MDKNILLPYIPEHSIDAICRILTPFRLKLKIVNPRKHIHGSYKRPKYSIDYHVISINRDLNPYSFLITLLHEIAHMQAWEKSKSIGHGEEWKICFMLLIKQFLSLDVFPKDIRYALKNHIQNIKSSDYLDILLSKALQKYDAKQIISDDLICLEDVPNDTVFFYENKRMKKQSLLRKYYLCKDLKTNKEYRCHPLMRVSLVEIKNNTK